MISLFVSFVLIGVLGARPVFAIPSPDFLGPVIAWVVAMIGISSAFIGTLAIWIRRSVRSFATVDRRIVWGTLAASIIAILMFIGAFAYVRFQNAKNAFRQEIEAHRQEMIATTTTSPAPQPEPIPEATSSVVVLTTPLSMNLLSSRVPTSTVLIPVETLHAVVAEPSWSDRIALIDIREAEEREVGQIDATTTWIRYGDLIHGASAQLPKDKDILVICWTSIRGEEIATWLRLHGFPRSYAIYGGLQGDTDPKITGWIDSGLPWRGNTKWSQVFGKTTSMSVSEAKAKYDAGATVIDVTSVAHFASGHIPGALPLPFKTAPTSEVQRIISLVPEKADLLIYCNGYVNCFYAKIFGIRLQRLGRTFVQPYDDVNQKWKNAHYPIEVAK